VEWESEVLLGKSSKNMREHCYLDRCKYKNFNLFINHLKLIHTPISSILPKIPT